MIFMGKEYTDITTEIFLKVFSRTVKGMAKGYLKELTEDIRKEFGLMINFRYD
jgi:hypothetical protein